ncbi:MAG TPA: hypothetical protein PLL72_07420 [Burkholderiaceae bacterium]|nr:hypothetical protein [Burkholderiaceae bacterium]
MSRKLLFEYTSAEAGSLALYREADGTPTIIAQSPGDALSGPATFRPPLYVLGALGDAAQFEMLQHKAANKVGD